MNIFTGGDDDEVDDNDETELAIFGSEMKR